MSIKVKVLCIFYKHYKTEKQTGSSVHGEYYFI